MGNGSGYANPLRPIRWARGIPGLEITHRAKAWGADLVKADLLVLGVRGGGPRGEMGSGHIGQDLLRTAPVAILTVPI